MLPLAVRPFQKHCHPIRKGEARKQVLHQGSDLESVRKERILAHPEALSVRNS